jgi:hypothetical protein
VIFDPTATISEALELGAAAAVGAYCIQAVAGETVSPELVAAALRTSGRPARVGMRVPTPRASEAAPPATRPTANLLAQRAI